MRQISGFCLNRRSPGGSGIPGASATILTCLLDRAKEERRHALAYFDEGVGQLFWASLYPDDLSRQCFRGGRGRNIAARPDASARCPRRLR
jgi:hypothetical protein